MGTRAIRRSHGAERAGLRCARGFALAAAALLAGPHATLAEEFLVTNTNNAGSGSLRQAILDLNDTGAVAGEEHVIVFSSAISDDSVINLLSPLEDIEVNVEIDASQISGLKLQGPVDATFLRTDTSRVALVDLGTQNNTSPGTLFSAIEIGARNALVFDTISDDFEVESDIRDATTRGGQLVKEGLGSLTLSGTNTYSGGTRVAAGTLLMTGTPPDTGRMNVEEGATLVLDPVVLDPMDPQPFTLNSQLVGTGTFVMGGDNGSDITLLGGGTFTGLTQIVDGTLRDVSGAIQGDIELDAPTASIVFEVDGSRTHSGEISGAGDVTKAGPGTLTLLGSNSYDGMTYLDEGTLIGSSDSLPGDIDASAFDDETMLFFDTTLIFDQSSAGTFDGEVWDYGDATNGLSFEKRGAGTLTLSGDVTAFRGTTLSQGRLIVDGFLTTSSTTVAAGTVLAGAGEVFGGIVDVAGSVAPGSVDASGTSEIGTLTVSSVTFQPGTVFEVDIGDVAAPQFGDSLDVVGSASLGSENILRVVPAIGTYATPVSQRILSARSLTGSFTFETDFFRLDVWCGGAAPALTGTCASTDGLNLDLWIVSNGAPWASAATTANQLAVGQILDAEEAPPGPSGDFVALFQDLQVIPREQVQPLLDALGGEPLSAFPTAELAIGERFNRAVHRRLRDATWGESEALFTARTANPSPSGAMNRHAAASPVAALPAADGRRAQARSRKRSAGPLGSFEGDTGIGAWIDGWGSLGTLEGDGNSADVDTRSFGATLGLDYRFGERVTAGLAGGYAKADIDLDGRASEGELDLALGALYAGYFDPRFHVSASGRYAHGWNDSERRIAFNATDLTTKASFDSWDVGARGEIGVDALRLGPVGVAPLAAFDWARLHREEFAESGAGSLDLVVEDDSIQSLLSSVGGSLWVPIDLGDDVKMIAELRGFWLHEFGDVERLVRARLSGAVASGSFEILGAELPRDRILAGLGWSASLGDAVRVFADYDVALANGLLQHELALTVRIHF